MSDHPPLGRAPDDDVLREVLAKCQAGVGIGCTLATNLITEVLKWRSVGKDIADAIRARAAGSQKPPPSP